MGVWVTVEGETDYIRHCFEEYNAHTDPSGPLLHAVQALAPDRPGGGLSVASVALRGEPTGVATAGTPTWWPPPSATCAAGEMLDGEGGYTVWGKLLPAATSLARAACRWAWRTASSWCGR
jgi:predicted homoserine dehydrogenase-like protein